MKFKTKLKLFFWKHFKKENYYVYEEWIEARKEIDEAVRKHKKVEHLRKWYKYLTVRLEFLLNGDEIWKK